MLRLFRQMLLAVIWRKTCFELVHERLVMINISAREQLLSEMISLTRPGGTVILEDGDNVSWLCHPAHVSWDVLRDTFHEVFHANGGNGLIGRALPGILRAGGVQNVQVKIDVDTPVYSWRLPAHPSCFAH